MYADHGRGFHQQRAVEVLARESRMSVTEVARLYEDEWAALEDGARITTFLAILTARNVRELLRRRSIEERPPT